MPEPDRISVGKIRRIRIGRCSGVRGFNMVLFTEPVTHETPLSEVHALERVPL